MRPRRLRLSDLQCRRTSATTLASRRCLLSSSIRIIRISSRLTNYFFFDLLHYSFLRFKVRRLVEHIMFRLLVILLLGVNLIVLVARLNQNGWSLTGTTTEPPVRSGLASCHLDVFDCLVMAGLPRRLQCYHGHLPL